MAYFRCGGSGIPASLKSGMNSVLNKKFGTSTTYDPSGWPDDVNLLGPLPVKSASGAIASFADGADGVPVKSCVVSFVASGGGGTPSSPVAITGVSGLSVTRTGKNWTDLSTYTDGFVKSNGQIDTAHTKDEMYSVFIPVPPNTAFHFEIVETSGTEDAWVGVGQYREANYSSFIKRSGYWNFTTDAECHYIVVSSRNLSTATKIQLELGSAYTSWEAYKTPVVVTDTFGQTIYGGTRDLVTDKASVTYDTIDLSTLTFNRQTNAQGVSYFSASISDMANGVINVKSINCSHYNPIACINRSVVTSSGFPDLSIAQSTGGKTINIRDDSFSDATAFINSLTSDYKLAYPLATPTELTGLTPHTDISTLYGNNNFFADTGTIAVEYRADIDLALNA